MLRKAERSLIYIVTSVLGDGRETNICVIIIERGHFEVLVVCSEVEPILPSIIRLFPLNFVVALSVRPRLEELFLLFTAPTRAKTIVYIIVLLTAPEQITATRVASLNRSVLFLFLDN